MNNDDEIDLLEARSKEVTKKLVLNPNIPMIYLLGLTGGGKSTLTNYLLGANLKGKQNKNKKWDIIN